ncbi:Lrp/AsnC family transcriptional regulator [Conexibacter woesei]|uniref:Transcriptional regulator, AsnC family n=1 Tax=Conexibacter woesei (strain DSM 14684 / CCUG 47730 / CIP 108061 / JCM 11494 / NBRC 100937 / ID131577) TaxID=469383 RepID=D3F9D7_CONWI|nr:Lrp/AsnC family transcriptional regulator [Conexibacter woesei]ADB49104.1 transcriptional regulator, AsnC family [Conexibacter woesei DSM 14684]
MSDQPDIDRTDEEIITLLRQDARRTFADIAERVSISAPAVKRRVDRLQQEGLIVGYTAIVDHRRLGLPLQAFVELRFDGRTKVDDIASVAIGITEVETLYTTAGDPDAVALIRARDVDDLKRVIDLLRRSRHVTGTKTLMVLGTSEPPHGLRR